MNIFRNFFRKIGQVVKNGYRSIVRLIKKFPFTSVIVALIILFILIAVGNMLRRPPEQEQVEEPAPKEVEAYRIGSVPRITVNGKIEKSHVVTIMAQSAGIVQKIHVEPGAEVKAATKLVSLSSNYQGAVMPTVQRQIAAESYIFQKETLAIQKDIIAKNREIANKTDENTDELANINSQSRGVTQDIINVSRDSLETIDDLIEFYEQSSTPDLGDAITDENIILGLQQQKAGLLSGVSAAEQALRQLNYTDSDDSPPAELSNLQKDVTLKQLDLQEKTLELNLDIAALNLRLAQIGESLMFPATPYAGKIERIFVRPGQSVTPGTPLAVLTGNANTITVVALVSKEIAQTISPLEESIVTVGDQKFSLYPSHIATEPTDGRLFAVTYTLPQIGDSAASMLEKGVLLDSTSSSEKQVTDGQFIAISIPVGYADTTSAFPFVPIDSVFQSQDASLIFVEENGVALSREITLGHLYGSYVEVREGLEKDDVVLLDRTLIEGDKVVIHD